MLASVRFLLFLCILARLPIDGVKYCFDISFSFVLRYQSSVYCNIDVKY